MTGVQTCALPIYAIARAQATRERNTRQETTGRVDLLAPIAPVPREIIVPIEPSRRAELESWLTDQRGYTRETNQVKPDLVAPGVDITSCAPGGGYVTRSGTSMASPFVTGGAALLMQWGIVDKNDPYLDRKSVV